MRVISLTGTSRESIHQATVKGHVTRLSARGTQRPKARRAQVAGHVARRRIEPNEGLSVAAQAGKSLPEGASHARAWMIFESPSRIPS
jgi:hypothetical protein